MSWPQRLSLVRHLPAAWQPRARLYLDLIRWDRPAGWLLLLWPTLMALWLAAGGWPGLHLLGVFVLGTVLMRSAGCCINDVADREFDRHVKRTAQRPVTSGRVSVAEALIVGAVLALIAFALVLTTNAPTVQLSFVAVAVTVLYPFCKRWVSMPQGVLGIAFSMGIPMAFAAVQGQVPGLAWALMAVNLFWVLAYDTEYAMVDRDDDLRLGIRSSAMTLGRYDVSGILAFYTLHLLGWVIVAWQSVRLMGGHTLALQAALLAAAAQVLWHGWLIRTRERGPCFTAFRANHWLGATLFAGVVLALL
ncbi:4-hydroxybenzoate octaprenyltransferase [Amphibiibacter pelophylacis]|uniref:4-hydroxybenzoate octaprenyltransferase n=1 Tax=Amphibiibacter pelophylacis TaxID=1799477 RepID=A0ACC6P119_9BURK